jgi:hypothetical protein
MMIHNFTISISIASSVYLMQTDSDRVGQSEWEILEHDLLHSLACTSVAYDVNGIDEAISIGRCIYTQLLPQVARSQLELARAKAVEESAVLRVLLKFGPVPLLQRIPWELMHDGHRALALDPVTSIVRYIEQRNEVKSLRVKQPVRMLFTTACPADVPAFDLVAVEMLLRRALKPFEASIQLDVRRNISLGRLRQVLIHAQEGDRPFHIWHHCGHGAHADDLFALVLTDALVPIISQCPALRLAVLDVCHEAALGGLAPGLSAINVPAIIGFRDQISDRVALDFTEALYGNLLRLPVDLALKQATRALFDPTRPLDWALPLLFLRTTDASFVSVQTDASFVGVQRVKANQSNFRARLRQELTDHFSEEELRTLCFDMALDYESLPAQGKAGKAREIVAQVERNDATTKLIEQCRLLRPNVPWMDMPEMDSRS